MKDASCLIIAEIGLNHNGNFDIARKSVIEAAKAGCNAVKFQNFKTSDFIQDRSQLFTYISQGKKITEPFYDLCARNEFKREWLGPIKKLCDENQLEFLSTPTSTDGIYDLQSVNSKYVKNGSDYLTHIPLIKAMAKSGMKIILSTGMADQADIDAAISALGDAWPDRTTLLHCTSAYPTPDEDVNLNKMTALSEKYGVPVGFSDHTEGYLAAVQAVTLGATIIEKHFTLDHELPGPDHWFSCDPQEMTELVRQVRLAETRLGKPEIKPAEIEYTTRDDYRIGVITVANLPSNHVLLEEDYAFKKPCKGILPKDIKKYVGRKLKKDILCGEPLNSEDFD